LPFTFATVAEGPTDHAILQNIILGLFREEGVESGDISQAQPLIDETGKQLSNCPGGWLQVFRWLEQKRYNSAFQFNDFVIVHLDTDACEESGYDIPKCVNGVARSPSELVELVRQKLAAKIDPADLQQYSKRFAFAIAVHGIECWLLPLWGRSQEQTVIHNCKQRVDSGLTRANRAGLRKDQVRSYYDASAEFKKKANLLEAAKSQVSLELFCHSLESLNKGKDQASACGLAQTE
jgi:hypothetical protein